VTVHVIDCSKPADDPDRVTVVDWTAEEVAEQEAAAAEDLARAEFLRAREARRSAAIARLEAFWSNLSTLSAGQVRTEAAFTAKVLAKVLPLIDIDV